MTISYWDTIRDAYKQVDIYNGGHAFLYDFRRQPLHVQHLLASHWCDSEVNNGGLVQFFDNPTGVLAPEAAIGFRAIGLDRAADVLDKAIARFGKEYPRDQETRIAFKDPTPRMYDRQFDRLHLPFHDLTLEFFDAIGDAEARYRAFDAYAIKHQIPPKA